jgi:hypothetical protein
VTTCKSAVRLVRVAFAEPGALERTVHHTVDIPGRQLLALRIVDNVIHSWDLASAIGVDPALDEQLVEITYRLLAPMAQSGALYATGLISAPTTPLPEGATSLENSYVSPAADCPGQANGTRGQDQALLASPQRGPLRAASATRRGVVSAQGDGPT